MKSGRHCPRIEKTWWKHKKKTHPSPFILSTARVPAHVDPLLMRASATKLPIPAPRTRSLASDHLPTSPAYYHLPTFTHLSDSHHLLTSHDLPTSPTSYHMPTVLTTTPKHMQAT